MFEITLLRHAESVGNAENLFQGHSDYPLTELGRRQAQTLADYWEAREVTYDLIICSPLLRAQQTAEIVNAALKLPIELDPLLKERNLGDLADLSFEEVLEQHPPPDFRSPYEPIAATGESLWELYLRAGQAMQDIMQRPAGCYLVVSHGGLLNMALRTIIGITPQLEFQDIGFRFNNTGYARLRFNPAKYQWRIECLNNLTHLDGKGI